MKPHKNTLCEILEESGADAWEVREKAVKPNIGAQKWEAKNSDFAWEVLQKWESDELGEEDCVGRAAVSCERGAEKRPQHVQAKLEAQKWEAKNSDFAWEVPQK